MGETAERLLSVDEFLAWDDGTDQRYQLLRGLVTMMAPPQAVHGALVARLASQLSAQLPRSCSSIIEAGIRPHTAATPTIRPIWPSPADRSSAARSMCASRYSWSRSSRRRPRPPTAFSSSTTTGLIPSIADILFVSSQRARSSTGIVRATCGRSRPRAGRADRVDVIGHRDRPRRALRRSAAHPARRRAPAPR